MEVTALHGVTGRSCSIEVGGDDTVSVLKRKAADALFDGRHAADVGYGRMHVCLEGHTESLTGTLRVADTQLEEGGRFSLVRKCTTPKAPATYVAWPQRRSIAVSPCGSLCALAHSGGILSVWDTASAQRLHLTALRTIATCVAFSPCSALLALSSGDGAVHIFAEPTWQRVRCLDAPHAIVAVDWSPDGARIAGGAARGFAFVWDALTGEVLLSAEGDGGGPVHGVALGPSTLAATAGNTVEVHLLGEGGGGGALQCTGLQVLEGHTDTVRDVRYTPDGRMLATASYDKTARLWDAVAGTCLRVLQCDRSVRSIAVSEGGVLATYDTKHTTSLWSLDGTRRAEVRARHAATDGGVALSPCGKWLFASGPQGVQVLEVDSVVAAKTMVFSTAGEESEDEDEEAGSSHGLEDSDE